MKSIIIYVAIVLAALISCTGAEAKRYHHNGKRAFTKTATIKHSPRVRHRQHARHSRFAAYAGRGRGRRTRHHSVSHNRRRLASREIWHGPYYQLVMWDGTLTGPLSPDVNGG